MNKKNIQNFIENKNTQNTILFLILFNSITIGLETSSEIMKNFGDLLLNIDNIIMSIFVIEIIIKLYVYKTGFFRDNWNIFDFIIVAIALYPASGSLSILRALRIFRSLRLLKAVPKLKLIVESLLHSLPSIGWIFVLLLLLFYVFAVIATKMFGPEFPEWFGTLGKSMYTLFQVMTLESWSMGIARPVLKEFPYAFLFFIPFILLATYTTLNIFIAIVVNTMSDIQKRQSELEVDKIENIVIKEHNALKTDLEKLKSLILEIESKISKTKDGL